MVLHESARRRAEARVGRALRDKYLLQRLIGIGNTSAVYEGQHRNGMPVAVKVLHPEIGVVADARRRFLREGYIANRIAHSGVVRILDDDEDSDGTAFIAMELLVGRTLGDEWRAHGCKMSIGRTTERLRALLDISHFAHAADVVHRDLKPDNVFIIQDGTIKVLDFGMARLLDRPRSTPSWEAIGAAEFSSPEQAGGLWKEVDARTDIYSLGAIMFTLLTGRHVHEGRNSTERLILAATKPAPGVRSLLPELGEDFARVVDRALSFRADDRWPSALAMREALENAATKLGPEAG